MATKASIYSDIRRGITQYLREEKKDGVDKETALLNLEDLIWFTIKRSMKVVYKKTRM